ncbi:transcriptional regulator [Macrococcus brunensis]|uniref:Transcriptional regulator n=1 Tax=Macrococcus brunensis TaxID=198483 RepID=A0A4R6BEQ0_9STAP|nr:helix-turn-helix transcriptional regulator [Macrococcus brunensis]TDL98265.1 transcriptional regulator [Macrococcus brunensis]ULG71599.1 helix-turn-helix transcriptional regulator [Macrococcus brunensis]ULG73862.1 helix-turn-helix transcriptional regulator [Macrococcus brunensis]
MENKLAEYRQAKGMSQQRLAEKLNVSRQTIISIEKGKYNPSLPLGLIIAELFDVDVTEIFILEESDY